MDSRVPTLKLNNGKYIPQLGLGVWKASESEAEFAVTEALKAGYRLIDTAAMYQNEAAVGRAVSASGIPREELFITTKLWNSNQGYASALAECEASLQRLDMEYVDLYLIHWPTPEQGKFQDTWRAFEQLQRDGKARSIGVSNFNPEHLEKLIETSTVTPALNQIEIHPDFQQVDVRQFCHEHGILVESWSPIGQGGELLEEPVITQLAAMHERTPAQIVIRWHLQSGLIVIPKSVHAERIAENFNVFDFELSEDDMGALYELDSGNRLGPNPVTMNNY